MNELIDQLSSVLEREAHCYEELIASARAEQQALIFGKLQELKLALEAQEVLLASTRALEETRGRLRQTLAGRLGLPSEGLTLTRLVELGYDDETGRIASLRDRIRKVVHDLDRLNAGNAQLINSSIDFINQTMWVLLQPRTAQTTYGPEGSTEARPAGTTLVDHLG